MIFNQIIYPPAHLIPRINYGNLSTIASSSQMEFPVTASGVDYSGKLPTVYNYSLGVQRELPFKLLLDVSYVGSHGSHLTSRYPFNEPAFGSAWLPENQDPTLTPMYDGTTTLPVDFTRPYVGYAGYGGVSGGNHPGGGGFITDFGGSSNYNALQLSLNRRLAAGLQFGISYSWSKSLGTQSEIDQPQHPTNNRLANYGPLTFDRTHNFVGNFIYRLPAPFKGGSGVAYNLGRSILNGWELSGITTFMSGAPTDVMYGVLGMSGALLNRMITGSEPQSPRVVMSGDPNLSRSSRTLGMFVDSSVFHPAVKGSQGMDSGRGKIVGPGTNNWDISLFKRVPLGKSEERYVQLRMEMYNAFNHTQFSGFNTFILFDQAGNIINLASDSNRFGFGAQGSNPYQIRSPRRIQLAMKFYF